MKILDLTSQITFLYFEDLDTAAEFFGSDLGLELAYDPGWAKVWRTGEGAFVGGVNALDGSIPITVRGGFLVSLTVTNIEDVYTHLERLGKYALSPIKTVKDIGLKSFFFKGPEGYDFEIQQFTDDTLRQLF